MIFYFCLAILHVPLISGIDEFTAGFAVLNCLDHYHPGCNKDFTDLYPEVRYSLTNTTLALTQFYLFTRLNSEIAEPLHKCAGRLPPDTKFRVGKKIYVIIPGYFEGLCISAGFLELKDQILIRDDVNVLTVDYKWASQADIYLGVENAKQIVAIQIAIILKNIMIDTGTIAANIHLIGDSLAGQIIGIVGQQFNPKIGRITGIESTCVQFSKDTPLDQRLDPGDAILVDVIHTNAGPCLPYFGADYPMGHADFIVNGGRFQVSCISRLIEDFLKFNLFPAIGSLIPTLCAHLQALAYYICSVNPKMNPDGCQFVSVRCDSLEAFNSGECNDCGDDGDNCAVMGYDFEKFHGKLDPNKSTIFYLNTTNICCYCDNSGINLNGFKTS